MEKENSNSRITYIDIARGISIILMIIGHVLEQDWKRDFIFSFHMPFFIIASGLFYKDRDLKTNLKNIFIKLILPYLITSFVVDLILIIKTGQVEYYLTSWINQILYSYTFSGIIKFPSNVQALGVLWFFPLLAIIKIIFIGLKKISKIMN